MTEGVQKKGCDDNSRITVIDYSEDEFIERELALAECCQFRDRPTVTWINVEGLSSQVVEEVGRQFGFHPLMAEDILSPVQRPKLDAYDDYIYLAVRMLSLDEAKKDVIDEQISIVLGKDVVLTFQQPGGDVFDSLRQRIRNKQGIIRHMGNDYLVYSLLDEVVDDYFVVMENIGDNIEALEEKLVAEPDIKTLGAIHELKTHMLILRKSVWPIREVINKLKQVDERFVRTPTNRYLDDVYDHTIQVIDNIETYRDMLSGMLDIYLSSVSNRMNEVMKVLTLMSTIFIPLTFIAGVYGMNFQFMPELYHVWGYPLALILMLSVGIAMLFFFRKKKWL